MGEVYDQAFYTSIGNVQLAPRAAAVMFRVVTPTAATRALISNLSAGGFDFILTAAHQLSFRIHDGSGTIRQQVHTTVLNAGSADIHIAWGQYEGHGGSGPIRVALDGGAYVGATNRTGYTPAPAAPFRMGMNATGAAGTVTGLELGGWALFDTIHAQAEWQTYHAACVAAERLVPPTVGGAVVHNVRCLMGDLLPDVAWVSESNNYNAGGPAPGSVILSGSATSARPAHRPVITRQAAPVFA